MQSGEEKNIEIKLIKWNKSKFGLFCFEIESGSMENVTLCLGSLLFSILRQLCLNHRSPNASGEGSKINPNVSGDGSKTNQNFSGEGSKRYNF